VEPFPSSKNGSETPNAPSRSYPGRGRARENHAAQIGPAPRGACAGNPRRAPAEPPGRAVSRPSSGARDTLGRLAGPPNRTRRTCRGRPRAGVFQPVFRHGRARSGARPRCANVPRRACVGLVGRRPHGARSLLVSVRLMYAYPMTTRQADRSLLAVHVVAWCGVAVSFLQCLTP
jgi:hypothetical protein